MLKLLLPFCALLQPRKKASFLSVDRGEPVRRAATAACCCPCAYLLCLWDKEKCFPLWRQNQLACYFTLRSMEAVLLGAEWAIQRHQQGERDFSV